VLALSCVAIWLIAYTLRTSKEQTAVELHDVVAHSLAVRTVQADGASYLIDLDAEQARKAMVTIGDTGRDARAGRYPAAAGEIAVNRCAADRLGVGPGSTLRLYGGDPTAAPVIATGTGATVGTASLRAFTDQELAARAPADLALFAHDQPITPAVVEQLRSLDAVRHVTPFQQAQATIGDRSYATIAVDLAALPRLTMLVSTDGALTDLGPGRVVLGEAVARDLAAQAGDQFAYRVEAGQLNLTVAAVLGGDAPLQSDVVLVPGDLDRLGGTRTGLLADFADGVGTRDATVAAVRQLGVAVGADVAVLSDYREATDAEVTSLFLIALGLLAMTVLIAVVGVGTTTALSVLERTQEVGLLRALGLSRRRLRAMILVESGLYGVVGAVLGLALGVPLAWLSFEALRLGMPPVLPAGQLLAIVAALAVITAMAGLAPARRAARVSPVAAIGDPD